MAFDQETGTAGIRKELVDQTVRQLLKRMYKLKQLCNVSTTTAWKNTFFRESSAILAGATVSSAAATGVADFEGIPRLANFPNANQTYEEVSAYIRKYGAQATISWEDALSDEVTDLTGRTAYKLAEGVMKSVDDRLFHTFTDGIAGTYGGAQLITPTNVNVVNITNGRSWDNSSAQIVNDVLNAAQQIFDDGYEIDDLVLVVNSRDYRSIMNYVAEKGAQWQGASQNVLYNGEVARIAGMPVIVSMSATTSYAVVIKPQIACTWKQIAEINTEMEEKPLISRTYRVAALGAPCLTDPLAVCVLTGTLSHT